MSMENALLCIFIGTFLGFVVGTGLAEDKAKKPTQEQKDCEFCHQTQRDGSPMPVVAKCGYEMTKAKYCPKCRRKLYKDDEDEGK